MSRTPTGGSPDTLKELLQPLYLTKHNLRAFSAFCLQKGTCKIEYQGENAGKHHHMGWQTPVSKDKDSGSPRALSRFLTHRPGLRTQVRFKVIIV